MTFLSGFIAIVGPPNVGKSTLLNRILGKKIAIVSPKPQTTRNRITGIYHEQGCQMVFMDTPGIHRTRTPLHRSMVNSAQSAFKEVDLLVLLIEMPHPQAPEIPMILSHIRKSKKPSVLVINKIDKGPKEKLLPIIAAYTESRSFKSIIPISALTGDGVESLVRELKSMLGKAPPFSLRTCRPINPNRFWSRR
jgi:GTPase